MSNSSEPHLSLSTCEAMFEPFWALARVLRESASAYDAAALLEVCLESVQARFDSLLPAPAGEEARHASQ